MLEDLDLLLGLAWWGRPMLPFAMAPLMQQLPLHVRLMRGLLLTHLVHIWRRLCLTTSRPFGSTLVATIVRQDQVALALRRQMALVHHHHHHARCCACQQATLVAERVLVSLAQRRFRQLDLAHLGGPGWLLLLLLVL